MFLWHDLYGALGQSLIMKPKAFASYASKAGHAALRAEMGRKRVDPGPREPAFWGHGCTVLPFLRILCT